jgi:hypothetical protein
MQPRQVLVKSEGPRDHFLWSLVVLLYVAVLNLYLPEGGGGATTTQLPVKPVNATRIDTARLVERVAALEASLAAANAAARASRSRTAQVVEGAAPHDILQADSQRSAANDDGAEKPRRILQTGGDDLHQSVDVHAENARIIKRTVTRLQPAGGRHRRMQSGTGDCDAGELPSRTAAITAECCDEASEDCTDGYPHTCNAGCAAVFLPFWADCRSVLGKGSTQFEGTVSLCEAAATEPGGTSLVQQLNLQCTDESLSEAECIPDCSEQVRGYLLLLNIDGNDSKLSCELHRGLYSWVGAATDGGYIGADIATFTSSIISAAPGSFVVVLMHNAGILADLTIQRGQMAVVSGDRSLPTAPAWGSSAFVVQQDASLSLIYVSLEGAITLQPGAMALTLSDCANADVITGPGVNVPSGTTFTIEATTPTTLVLGVAPLAGDLVISGPITLSNTNIITLASTAFGDTSVTVGGGVTCYLPNQLVPVLDGSMPGTLTAAVDGQTVGTLSTSASGTVSSVPLGWYTTLDTEDRINPTDMWDSGALTNVNGYSFSLYLLPAQPPNHFAYTDFDDGAQSLRRYAELCIEAGLHTATALDVPPAERWPPDQDGGCAWLGCIPVPTDCVGESSTCQVPFLTGSQKTVFFAPSSGRLGGLRPHLSDDEAWYAQPRQPLCAIEHGRPTPTMPSPLPGTEQVWGSRDYENGNGKSFTLYLLPAQPPNFFSISTPAVGEASLDAYVGLCQSAGLQVVEDRNACEELSSTTGTQMFTGCPDVVPVDPTWLVEWTGWDHVVFFDQKANGYVQPFVDGDGFPEWVQPPGLDVPLHPVCGLQHDRSAPSPPGDGGGGGAGHDGSAQPPAFGGGGGPSGDEAVGVDIMASSARGYTTMRFTVTLAEDQSNVYAIYSAAGAEMSIPPAFQVATPFGSHIGGVSPLFYGAAPDAEFDSWLTIGEVGGDPNDALSSVGIDFTTWDENTPLDIRVYVSGAVFWMVPADGPGGPDPIVLAQLTVPAGSAGVVTMGVQGMSVGGEDYQGGVMWTYGGAAAPAPAPDPTGGGGGHGGKGR